MKTRPYLLALALLICSYVSAQEEATEQKPEVAPSTAQWSLGLGVISSPRPYVGAENSVMAIPIIGLNYKKLYIQGIQAGYHFVDNKNFTFDARAGIVFAGLDPDDSPYLEGMEKRESTIDGGFVFDWKPGKFKLSASAYTDLLGRSDGQQAALDFSRSWRFNRSRWGITPSVGFVWQSSNFVDYYFGVSPEEARPGRPPFDGHSVINFRSSLLVYYFVTMRVQVAGLLRVQRLDNEIYESPIVEDRRGYFGLIGATWRFGRLPPRPSS